MAKKLSKYQAHVESLFDGAREKNYPKNQIICYQGDVLSSIYMVKKGYIKSYTILDSGDTRTMFILSPGDIFPIAFSLTLDWDSYQLRYFYQSLTDSTLALLDHEALKKMIETNPQKANIYMEYMSATNKGIMDQLEVMKNKTAKNKVSLLLPYLISKLGREVRPNIYELKLKLSHQEIADLSGITRETTTALLKELEHEGVIRQKKSTWEVYLEPNEEEIFLG